MLFSLLLVDSSESICFILSSKEVTAFHPTALCTEVQENTEVAVSVPACAPIRFFVNNTAVGCPT
jgi:hypothetical protein